MRSKTRIRWFGIIVLATAALFPAACTSGTESRSSFTDQIVTKDNSAQLAQESKTQLSYEDYQLLQGFIKRVYPDQPEGTLPVGMPVETMIQSQKAYLDAQASKTGETETTGEAAENQPPTQPETQPEAQPKAKAATKAEPAPSQAAPSTSVANRPSPKTESKPTASPPANSTESPSSQAVNQPSSEPVSEPASSAAVSATPAPQPPAAPREEVIPAGETLTIRLAQALSSKTARTGQKFEGTLDEDLQVDNMLVAPAGSKVVGKVAEAVPAGKVKGKAKMALELTGLEVAGQVYDISTHTLSFEAQGSGKEDVKKVGIASGIGAVIGAIAGGGKGAAIGATIGAGAGTGVVLATSGDEVEFPNEQRMVFKLTHSVTIPVE